MDLYCGLDDEVLGLLDNGGTSSAPLSLAIRELELTSGFGQALWEDRESPQGLPGSVLDGVSVGSDGVVLAVGPMWEDVAGSLADPASRAHNR